MSLAMIRPNPPQHPALAEARRRLEWLRTERLAAIAAATVASERARRIKEELAAAEAECARLEGREPPDEPPEPPPVRVSDHAVIRYLERRFGFDFESVRAAILTPGRVTAIDMGARRIRAGQVEFVVAGRVVVTAAPKRVRERMRTGRPRDDGWAVTHEEDDG